MSNPDLEITPEAIDHVRQAANTWKGDNRDLALALVTMGHALLLILDGRTDHIALYEEAARAVAPLSRPQGSA